MTSRTRGTRRTRALRDQRESAFAAILADLIARVPGARAAALVDRTGETVDYSGDEDPYGLRVVAAHFRIVLDHALAQRSLATVATVVVRAARATFFVQALPDGYAVVLWLSRGAGFRGLSRAVPACASRLADEAGWEWPPATWRPIDVVVDARARPRAVRSQGREVPIEVLGRFRVSLPRHERAWRVRVQTGAELTLLRESGGFWYADDWIGA